MVNVGNQENPSYLPAEVCVILPGQTIKQKLSSDQTSKMIKFACRRPAENGRSIVGDGKAVLGLSPGQNPTLVRTEVVVCGLYTDLRQAEFGVAVGTGLITVAARVLDPPIVKYRDSKGLRETSVLPDGGSWNMRDIKFHTGSNLGRWTYIRFTSNRDRDYFGDADYQQTVSRFQTFLTRSGINSDGFIRERGPPTIDLRDGDKEGNDSAIKNIFRGMSLAPQELKPRFVLCILPYHDTAIYNSIKTAADTKAGIQTVCVIGSKFMKEGRGQDQYFGNVSLKFNLKAGGINQTVEPAKLGVISEGKTMVVGLDVTHPSPGSEKGAPSVAAIVASVDKFLGQWPGTFSMQEGRKEMVSSLGAMFLSRLRLWQKRNNNQLPENIILYRDGVSEGQYQQVLDQELPLVRNACRQAYPPTAITKNFPRISIIVCGKRHHTRFYPTEGVVDRYSNCNPGTIVDRGVTEVRLWDFFLQAHASIQGTARPAHYVVVLDEVFRGRAVKPPYQNAADSLEDLTLHMCHLFGRATKAVSLCPAAYYADILCTRVRCYLSEQFEPSEDSATPSISSGVTQGSIDVSIPDSIVDTMYYI